MDGTQRELRPAEQVMHFVTGRVQMLQEKALRKDGRRDAARQLAQLRRAAGKRPGAMPEVWSIEFDGLPQDLVGRGDSPSRGEWAVHIALTLYAVHQQSQTTGMHIAGWEHGFGQAVRRLVRVKGEGSNLMSGQMPRRLAAMVTAQSTEELAHYARQLVGQLRSESISFDYGRFSRQVYLFQSLDTRDQACLAWAREYAWVPDENEASASE